MLANVYLQSYGKVDKTKAGCPVGARLKIDSPKINYGTGLDAIWTGYWAGGSDPEVNKQHADYQIDISIEKSTACGIPEGITAQVQSRQLGAFQLNLIRLALTYILFAVATIVTTRDQIAKFTDQNDHTMIPD